MINPTPAPEPTLVFNYLYLFRRLVVSLAFLGAALAWAYQLPALMAAFLCVGIGELVESSYYIGVLRWRQQQARCSGRTPGLTVNTGPG